VVNNDRLLQTLDQAVSEVNKAKVGTMHLLLMGDFNYPDINYSSHVVLAGPDSPAHRFFDKTQDLFLVQYVDQCTRFREGYMPSTLDYTNDIHYTLEPNLIENIEYQAPMGKSDHVCMEWSLTVHKEQETTSNMLKRDFWEGNLNYVKINEELRCMNWTEIFTGKSIDDKWKIFKGKLLPLVDSYIPFKADVKKKKVKSLSKNTMRHIKLRDEVWQDYRKQPTQDKFRRCKAVWSKTNSMVRLDHATSR